jgi:hypothetical protein
MPKFKIVARTPPVPEIEFQARDMSSALAVGTMKMVDADLLEEGVHKFVVRRDDDSSELWMIAGASPGAEP